MDRPPSADNLHVEIQEYESLVDSLTSQLQFYANEQENLRKEIALLVRENKLLSQTVGELMESKITAREVEDKQIESELVENLKTQLTLIAKEKDTVVELWQAALKNIDRLEEDIKLYEGRTCAYISKSYAAKIMEKYQNVINTLEHQLFDNQTKVDQLSQIIIDKESDLDKAKEVQTTASSQFQAMEKDLAKLQNKLEEIIKIRDDLQIALDKKKFTIDDLQIREVAAKAKVTEAIQLIEAACLEKNAAIYNETKAKDEVLELSKTLSEILKETPEKIKADVKLAREECNAKMDVIHKHLEEASREIEKLTAERNSLSNEINILKSGKYTFDETHISKLLILEKNLEATFQKLLLAEKRNMQFETEKESLKADLEQMGDCYKRDINAREVEKGVLTREVKSLKKKLQSSTAHVADVTTQVKKFKSDLLEKMEEEQVQTQKIEAVRSKYEEVQTHLYQHLEIQIKLHKKWKKEIYRIFKQLVERINTLKTSNKSLRKKLKKAITGLLEYKTQLNDILVNIEEDAINENENVTD